ncbi:MAG TPA: PEP-CTERM sorting domain-containing protein [Casimicrobiaceae bacterium]|nr:PEP-CTERM sorting domain-containing protein [Casimicrobiaceae bacterium]
MSMKTLAHFCALALGMLLWSTANAVVILVLDNDGVPSFQQQNSSPCVIGNPSCHNPAGFGFNDISGDDGDGTVTFAESTQTYLVSQVTGIVGNAFNIGIDTNQAGNFRDTSNWLRLQTFDVLINNVLQFQYNVAAPGTPINLINGGGYSDATLSSVDLSAFLATDTITFRTLYNNATNGPESFFLYSTTAQPCTVNCTQPVPEPGTLILLGSALAALGGFARRKARTGFQA